MKKFLFCIILIVFSFLSIFVVVDSINLLIGVHFHYTTVMGSYLPFDVALKWIAHIVLAFGFLFLSVFCVIYIVRHSNAHNKAKFSYEEYKTKKLENRERKKQERIRKAEAKLSKLKRLEK